MHNPKILQFPSSGSEQIIHYTMEDLLPKGACLALHLSNSSLSLLTMKDGLPHLIAEEKFTAMEMRIVHPLLLVHPYFCTHAIMHSSHWFNSLDEENILKAQQRLNDADATGVFDSEMGPIRKNIYRVRLKMHSFDIDIVSTLKVGWSLQPHQKGFFGYGR